MQLGKRLSKCAKIVSILWLLAFLTGDIFAIFGVMPLSRLRANKLQDAIFYTGSYLYPCNFIISAMKSRYSHCFNCLKLFYDDRNYPKNDRFWAL